MVFCYVVVGGVVPILSLMGFVLILFFFVVDPYCCKIENMNAGFFCGGGPHFGFCFCYVLKTFVGGCCFY